jgi:chromosome segregation and condensation protein ScpB
MEEQGANSENQNSKKFLEDMNKVETILFTTGGYLKLEDLSGLTGIKSQEHLQNVLNTLKQKYSVGESSLEIVQQGNQWKLAIKKNYLPLTEQLLKFEGIKHMIML